jgi:antitoxin HigA-1
MMSILNNTTEGREASPNRSPMAKRVAQSYPAGRRQVAPAHPGEVIASALEDCRETVRSAATKLGVSHVALGNVLNGKSAISPEMAVRIGKLLGNGPELWLRMQQDYDLWHATQALGKQVEAIPTLKAVV